MSDVAAPAPAAPGTPAIPAVQPQTPAPAEPEQLTSFGRAAKVEARRSMHAELRRTEPSAPSPTDTPNPSAVDALGREHAADGKYMPGSPGTPAATQPDPNATAPATASTPANDPAASQPSTVRIPLPADHPLRAQGLDSIEAPAQQEMQYRALVNAASRRADVERYAAEKSAAEQRATAAEAANQALQEQFFALLQRPDLAQQAADIEQAYGPQAKAQYLAGLFAQVQQSVSGKVTEAQQKLAQEQAAQQAEQVGAQFYHWMAPQAEAAFRADGWPVDAQFGQHLRIAMDRAAEKWSRMEAAGQYAELNTADIHQELVHVLWENPAYREAKARHDTARQQEAAATQQREAEARVRADFQAQEAARLADAARSRRSMNPLAQAPSSVQTGATSTRPEAPDLTGLSGPALKKAVKAQMHKEMQGA